MKDRLTVLAQSTYIIKGVPTRACWELEGSEHMTCEEICQLQPDSNGCAGCPIDQAFTKLAEYENIDPDPGSILFHTSYNYLCVGFIVGSLVTSLVYFIVTHLV